MMKITPSGLRYFVGADPINDLPKSEVSSGFFCYGDSPCIWYVSEKGDSYNLTKKSFEGPPKNKPVIFWAALDAVVIDPESLSNGEWFICPPFADFYQVAKNGLILSNTAVSRYRRFHKVMLEPSHGTPYLKVTLGAKLLVRRNGDGSPIFGRLGLSGLKDMLTKWDKLL